MKTNKTIIFGAFALIFLQTLFCFAQEDAKIPIAVLAEKVYKLDNVIEGTLVTHDFILKNQGTADLVIEKVESG
ncbi:MAG: DUF1573 domain-containing protein [Desulfobacterales bacterium]|jgi:hypothetical protein|nr:DUF1573 domain-containing protein [Desulfobacterales bacterium]